MFVDDDVVRATEPATAVGFALRDGSAELRRLFLHALARFGESETTFVPRGNQRPFAGVSANAGERDTLFAPLIATGRTLGVVAVQMDGEPSAEDRSVLAAFCGIATRTLDTQRALVAARRQSRDSHLLAMVNERLHKSLDRRDVLFGIVEGVRSAFSADRCVVYGRMPDGEQATVAAAAAGAGVPPLAGPTRMLDADLRKAFAGLSVRRDDEIALPFVVDGHVEDVLVLSFGQRRVFDDADFSALRSLAFHVGLALSNASLYERERNRRSQAESLERVVRILRDTQYVDEVLLVFVVTVSHELPLDCFAYSLDGDELVRRASRIREPRGFDPATRINRTFLEPFLAVDEPSDAALVPHLARHQLWGDRSGAIVPLRIDGALWGCFVVRAADPDSNIGWPAEERATFFRTLGSHLEIALANARAYERELRRAQEREILAEAARSILGHADLESLAGVITRMACQLLGAQNACVLRWGSDRYDVVGSFGNGLAETIEQSGMDLMQRVERFPGLVSDERRVQRQIDGPGYVVIPLTQPTGSDEIDAFLLVGRENAQRFGRDDLRILQELGALLSLAFRNVELYEGMGYANRALHESNEFKDDLLAMLAHDFKGPLTVINGYCELMLEGSIGEFGEEVREIHEQSQRLVRLSEDALVLAQTQSQGFSLARATTELGAFVGDCVEATAPNNPRVDVKIAPEPMMVDLDQQRFRHVIDNLISNALKYSKHGVEVSVRRDGARATIEVTDHGIGIPEIELAGLFTRFGRASNARSLGISGSGVGLYVARKVVEVHGGQITVRSTEGIGSTFVVTLPLISDGPQQ